MYQVPVLRGVHHRTVATLHEAHDVFEILELLDTKYANEDVGLDVEASDLYPNQHDWDFTGFSFSVITSMDDKEWVGRSWYFNWKYPARYLNAADRLKLLNWMEKNQERLWAFNNSYELKAFWRVLGKPLLLRDARGLTLAGDVKGSLKALVQRFCGAHEWEVDNGNLVSGIQQMRSAINRADSDNLLPAIRERRNHIFENDLPLERDIYKFLTPEELKFIENELNFPLVKYYKDRKNAQPSMPVMATEKVLSKEGKKRQKKYEAAETAYQDAVKVGDTPTAKVYLEVMQEYSLRDEDYEDHEYEVRLSMAQQAVVALMNYSLTEREILETFTGLTGWYGSPTRILGPYCCWDTYYTLVLRKVFGTDSRLENACIYFEQEVRFAGVLESYNQTWDEEVAEELNQNYMKLMGDGQHDCIRYIGLEKCLEWEDEFGCWRDLFDALSIGCVFPITVKMKRWVGGFYISTKTANVGRPGLLERHLNAYQETLNGSDELKAAAAQNGLQMLISDNWVPVTPDNVRAMPEEMYPIKLRFSIEKGRDREVEEYDAVVKNPNDRLAWLKDIWNPASPNRAVSDKFWDRFLTPRVITANLFYGMRRILMTAQVWDLMEGQMVEIEEQDVNPDGSLKFDKEGDPVFKKEKRPCKISILQPDGTIKVVEEFIIDMKDLESTLGNMMALQEMIKHVPFSLVDNTYETIKDMSESEKEERALLKELHESNRTLKVAIQESIDHLNDYMDWQTGDGLSGDKVVEQYDVLSSFLGLKCDKIDTWFEEYRLLLGLRIYKKAYKARNTYVVGAKLGRGQVFEVITPDNLGMNDLPDMWHSHSMPIYQKQLDTDSVGSPEWKEKCDKRLFSLQEQFKPCTTETRRWKSRQHTVPAGSELRRTYVPRRKGWLASHADFSGCELATCAAIANEQVIIKTFQTGGDIHMNTASGVFSKPPSEISPMQRRWAKTCTFLCLYGGTVETLARELGGRMDRAQFVMDGFFRTYPGLENYIVSYRRMAVEKGYVFTLNGSPLNLDTSDLAKLNCTSINYPIQSSATNCCGSTFYSMWEALYFKLQLPFVACGFTHDSIDASYPTQAMFLMIPMQKYLAEYIPWKRLGVPARLDNEIGIDSYSLCHVKVLSNITSGNTIENPHKCEIGGLERNVLPVIELMKEYFDNVEVEFHYGKKKPQSMSELWLGSRAIDDSQLIHLHPGQFDQELEVVITCTNKPDSPYKSPVYGDHEEYNNCITVQAINLLQKGSL